MKKQDIIDKINDLPVAMREQLADEIYQSLDSSESGLNSDWIIEANHLMRKLENTPPAIPKEDPSTEEEAHQEDSGDNQRESLFELINKLRLHCTLHARTKSSKAGEGIPHKQVRQDIKERRKEREKLLGDLEVSPDPVPDVVAVEPLDDFKLQLTFEGGEQRIFDLKPFRKGIFSELQDPDYFSWVRLHWGGIRWPYGEQLYSSILYPNSVPKK